MHRLSLALAIQLSIGCLAGGAQEPQTPQPALPRLNIVIVEGEGAINNVKQRTSREAIVQVEDENHRPVAGASVLFLLPGDGAGGVVAGGARNLTLVTDQTGRAALRFQPNQIAGRYQIRVTATSQGRQASTVITQSNTAPPPAVHHGISAKVVGILAGAAAAGAVGIWAAQRGGGTAATPTSPSGTITGGTPAFR